jgi:hypothetical protein
MSIRDGLSRQQAWSTSTPRPSAVEPGLELVFDKGPVNMA